MIRTRQVSAREVMAAHLDAHRPLQSAVNAIVAKLDDDAVPRARRRRRPPRRERRAAAAAARPADRLQGSAARRRLPVHARLADLQGRDADRGLRVRRAAAPRRRDPDRQDQRARVRHGLAHLQQGLRHDRESLRPDEERRRLERRRRRGARGGHAADRRRQRSRRLAAQSRQLQQRRRLSPERRPHADVADVVAAARLLGQRAAGAHRSPTSRC